MMVGSLAENAQRSFWDKWAKVTCPTLAALGQSGIIPPQEGDDMLRQRPDTVAGHGGRERPRDGHDVHLEQPDVLYHPPPRGRYVS
jgi:pimeloyl-ACP methyl ester carboxylesterase